MKTAKINNKTILYTENTKFVIQISKNKSSYITIETMSGDLKKIFITYDAIKLDKNSKKRLIIPARKNQLVHQTL